MKLFCSAFIIFTLISCQKEKIVNHNFSQVEVNTVYQDSISIRAITIRDTILMFAGTRGKYGNFEMNNLSNIDKKNIAQSFFREKNKGTFSFENDLPHFRAIADTEKYFFVLSIANPALLYKINKESGKKVLVYIEKHEKVFYDAIAFWNNKEGIAIGDPTGACLSVVITRDGGENWNKVPCTILPATVAGEAAFAASNGNISIVGDKVWIASGGMKSRVYYSPDKGMTWEVFETPIIQGTSTTGAYSLHFYDENKGVVYGGDYTKPEQLVANKAITNDGGKTWKLIADGMLPGYKSCVRYIPNSGGKELVVVGFTGISISNDEGAHWNEISKEAFYTLRFITDSTAIAAGKNSIAYLVFR